MNILLVHGLAGSSRWWRNVVPTLEERHRVEVVDLPRRHPGDAVAARAHGTVLVGHSLGGLVCVQAAVAHPDRVRALVLVQPVGVPLGRSAIRSVAPLARVLVTAPASLPLLARDAVRAGPLMLMRGAATALTTDIRTELSSLRMPTLLVWGSRDPLVPEQLAQEWRRGLPHARLVVLEGASHLPMLDRPRELAETLLEFLEELEDEMA